MDPDRTRTSELPRRRREAVVALIPEKPRPGVATRAGPS
jgi:hypothetical protein